MRRKVFPRRSCGRNEDRSMKTTPVRVRRSETSNHRNNQWPCAERSCEKHLHEGDVVPPEWWDGRGSSNLAGRLIKRVTVWRLMRSETALNLFADWRALLGRRSVLMHGGAAVRRAGQRRRIKGGKAGGADRVEEETSARRAGLALHRRQQKEERKSLRHSALYPFISLCLSLSTRFHAASGLSLSFLSFATLLDSLK